MLIVDNDPVMLDTFAGLLKSLGGFLKVHATDGVRSALHLIGKQKVDLVISGFHMPEIGCLELMLQVSRRYPEIRIIILARQSFSLLRAKIKKIPTAVHFDLPMDMSLLSKRIFFELGIVYGGQVSGVSMPSFLQMLELEERSCSLLIHTKGKSGMLHILDGEPVAARCNGFTAKDAVLEMLTWENVIIDIDYASPKIKQEISWPLVSLILESGRLIDDAAYKRSDKRKHDRFDCHVVLDFDAGGYTYQCCMQDISHGGAYFETEKKIMTGQKIILTLCSPRKNSLCAVNGIVARQDAKGLAITFDRLGVYQEKLIQALISKQGTA